MIYSNGELAGYENTVTNLLFGGIYMASLFGGVQDEDLELSELKSLSDHPDLSRFPSQSKAHNQAAAFWQRREAKCRERESKRAPALLKIIGQKIEKASKNGQRYVRLSKEARSNAIVMNYLIRVMNYSRSSDGEGIIW